MQARWFRYVFLVMICGVMAACGGGGGADSGTPVNSNNGSEDTLQPIGTNTENRTSPLGTNISRIGFGEALWFINQTPRAVGWLTQCDDCNATTASGNFNTEEQSQLELDENGWVKSFGNNPDRKFTRIALHLFASETEFAPGGDWVILYDGEATIDYGFEPFVQVVSRSPGRDVIRVTPQPDSLLIVRISAINRDNYLRNLRIIPPGGVCGNDPFRFAENAAGCGGDSFEAFETRYDKQRFHPLYLSSLRRYSTLRFMQFQATVDDLTEKTFAQRTHLTDAIWPDGPTNSPPQELMFELSNQVHADAWVNMPYWASDDWVRGLATLAHSMLATDLNVYVEYSNEVWNGAFPYSLYGDEIEARGVQKWPASLVGNDVSAFDKRINFFGMRSAQMCAVWKEVFGSDASRVRCVMGAAPFGYWADQALSCPLFVSENGGKDCGTQMYAVAAAPYFGGYIANPDGDTGREGILTGWAAEADGGLNRIFNELRTGQELKLAESLSGAIAAAMDVVDQNREVATARKLHLVSYEGGQHLAPIFPLDTNTTIGQMLVKANRDSRMEDLYVDYLSAWRTHGGELFMHYQDVILPSERFGSWGAIEYVGQPLSETPKLRGIQRYITDQPSTW